MAFTILSWLLCAADEDVFSHKYYLLGWSSSASWPTAVALPTTSIAVVYAVMVEFVFNKTDYGNSVLAACLINEVGTKLTLGFVSSPHTLPT